MRFDDPKLLANSKQIKRIVSSVITRTSCPLEMAIEEVANVMDLSPMAVKLAIAIANEYPNA